MKFNQESLKGPEPVPAGVYTVRFESFKPQLSKNKDSINLNAKAVIVGHGDLDGRVIFAGLNSKIPNWTQDFVHSFGLEMEDQLGTDPSIPGVFDGDPVKFKEDDPSTWTYKGPLLGRTAKWEVGTREYEGRLSNEPRQFICAVPGCATKFPEIKHSKDMGSKK